MSVLIAVALVIIGSILLITSLVDTTYRVKLEPIDIAVWAIPMAIGALVIHGIRMLLLDRKLDRMATAAVGEKDGVV